MRFAQDIATSAGEDLSISSGYASPASGRAIWACGFLAVREGGDGSLRHKSKQLQDRIQCQPWREAPIGISPHHNGCMTKASVSCILARYRDGPMTLNHVHWLFLVRRSVAWSALASSTPRDISLSKPSPKPVQPTRPPPQQSSPTPADSGSQTPEKSARSCRTRCSPQRRRRWHAERGAGTMGAKKDSSDVRKALRRDGRGSYEVEPRDGSGGPN